MTVYLYFNRMIMKSSPILAISFALVGFLTPAHAGTSTYQVTGPVLEVTDSKIVIQKEKEKWEIARTPDTKITGEMKVGAKVTIQYTMTAASVEVKAAKSEVPTTPKMPAKMAAPAAPAKGVPPTAPPQKK